MGRSGGGRSSSGGSRSGGMFGSRGSSPVATKSRPMSTATAAAPATMARKPDSHAPQAQPQSQAPAQAQSQAGGGMMSGLAGSIMSGMAFGGGSAIAHRAIDGIMGPREVVHKHEGGEVASQGGMQTAARSNLCQDQSQQFQQCLKDNSHDLDSCKFFMDSLSSCQKNSRQ